jgi:hypothetical protein
VGPEGVARLDKLIKTSRRPLVDNLNKNVARRAGKPGLADRHPVLAEQPSVMLLVVTHRAASPFPCGIPTPVAQRRFSPLLGESQYPLGFCFQPPKFQCADAVRYDFRLFMSYRPALYARSHEVPQALYRQSPLPKAQGLDLS